MLAIQLGEPGRWDAPQIAVRSDFVVVLLPEGRAYPSLVQGLKSLLIEMLIAELAAEALDVAVVHGASRLDQDVAHTM